MSRTRRKVASGAPKGLMRRPTSMGLSAAGAAKEAAGASASARKAAEAALRNVLRSMDGPFRGEGPESIGRNATSLFSTEGWKRLFREAVDQKTWAAGAIRRSESSSREGSGRRTGHR